jgi:hypothetical protein
VARNADGALQIFGTGQDGSVWTRWQIRGADQTARVRNVRAGRDSETSPAAPGVLAFDNWSPWTQLDGSFTQVAAAPNLNGTIELFGINGSGAIFHRRQTASDAHTGWTADSRIPGTLSTIAVTSPPTNSTSGGRLVVYGTTNATTDNVVEYVQSSRNDHDFNPADPLPGVTVRTVTAATDSAGYPEVIGEDDNGHIFTNTAVTPDGVNNELLWKTGFAVTSTATARNSSGRLEEFITDSSG